MTLCYNDQNFIVNAGLIYKSFSCVCFKASGNKAIEFIRKRAADLWE